MGRSPCCDKDVVKRGPWSPEEDATLKKYIEKHGHGGNWIALPHKAGLNRCGKSCRLRWLNYLRPNIKHGGFTEDEDNIIWTLYNKIGSRWSVIASKLNGRTDNDVKNYWNTKLKRKLIARQQLTEDIITYKFTNDSINLDHQTSPTPQQPATILPTIKSEHDDQYNIICSNNNNYYMSKPQQYSEMMPFSMMSLLEQPELCSSMNEHTVYSSEVSAASTSTTSSFSTDWTTNEDELLFSQIGLGDFNDFLSSYEYQDKLGDMFVSSLGNIWNTATDQNKMQDMHQSVTYS